MTNAILALEELRISSRRGSSGALVAALGLAALVSGCGNLTAGGASAEADVVVTGDGSGGSASSVSSSVVPAGDLFSGGVDPFSGGVDQGWGRSETDRPPTVARSGASDDDDGPEGEIEVTFRAFLIADDGSLVELTEDEVEVNVDIPGRTEAEVVRGRTIPAETYPGARIVFSEIEVEVDEGLVIGGVPVLGEIEVELEAETLEVERSVNLQVPDGGRVELVIDLNSTGWLNAANPALKIVAANVFRNAVQIRVR